MKKSFLLLLLTLLPMLVSAYDAVIDGIYYNLNQETKKAEVTNKGSYNSYSGNVVIPSSIAFKGVEYSVTIIRSSAFQLCSGLTSVTIPNSVTSIGDWAFYDCTGLTSITIPNSVTSIGDWAFYDCTGLTSITIPNSVTSIGESAFYGCSGLKEVNFNATNCKTMGSRIYPPVFSGCTSLATINIGNNVQNIPSCAFYGCSRLTSVTIPNSVTTIGGSAFYGCSRLTSITIPSSVTSIGGSAFTGCSELTSVHISDLAAWCRIAFGDSSESDSVSNPLGIAHHLFLNGEEVKDLVIPSSVSNIGYLAFWACHGLTSVTIPSSVTSIGRSAFPSCHSLASVTIGDGVTNIDSWAFYNCQALTSVTIGNSVTSIGEGAFNKCPNLTSINIPQSVTNIGNKAFVGCTGLTSITIPSFVTNIGEKAFSGCDRIQFIYSKNPVPPTCASTNTFASDIYKYAYLYVPTKSVPQYKTAYEWRNFTNIIGQDDEGESPYQMEVVLKNGTTTTYDLDDIKEVNIINR